VFTAFVHVLIRNLGQASRYHESGAFLLRLCRLRVDV